MLSKDINQVLEDVKSAKTIEDLTTLKGVVIEIVEFSASNRQEQDEISDKLNKLIKLLEY
ncbi:MAG: hypothetical protein LBV67_09500 [Streptococcaceae bacterium]|jgi:hypothetical protein|nr:hypothetical protein [Streptococcaceae bacterium]